MGTTAIFLSMGLGLRVWGIMGNAGFLSATVLKALGSPRSSGHLPFLDATASAADFRGAEPKARG